LWKKWDNIELIEEDLSLPEYRRTLRDCDVFLFPYEAERYRTATSNIVGQVLALGKACVVTADTWLADSVQTVGFGEVCDRTPVAFAEAVSRCIAQLKSGCGVSSEKVAEWRSIHSAYAIVAAIEREGDPRRYSALMAETVDGVN